MKSLLNIESGVNDGLALPLVLICLSVIGDYRAGFAGLALELFFRIAIPWIALLAAARLFPRRGEILRAALRGCDRSARARDGVDFAREHLSRRVSAGVTVASTRPSLRDEFHQFGELITELLKLATLLVFGAWLTPQFFRDLHALDYLFAALALVLARPAAMLLSLWRSELDWRERLTASWFGPKGFASVVYGLLLFERHVPHAERLFQLIALVIAGSIVAHSSTDTLLARWFVSEKTPEGSPDVA